MACYGDASCLNQRLTPLLHHLQRRKALQQKKPKRQRHDYLQECLGPERYQQAVRLVEEIKQLRLQHASLGCAKCQQEEGACQLPTKDKEPYTSLPEAIRGLFFSVTLVNYFEQVSTSVMQKVTSEQWDAWIQEAQTHLQRFHEWRYEV